MSGVSEPRPLLCVQVITSLRSAVKELVENALDAGASSVEVHLCDHGATSIEVIDNGHGVRPDDFEAVGMPLWCL